MFLLRINNNMVYRFLKLNYSPKVLIGTLCANTVISVYRDKKFGYNTPSPIVEGCSDTTHVFYSTSRNYDINREKLLFNIPFSMILGIISVPINFHMNIIKGDYSHYSDKDLHGCLCGKIK